ncbi:MAG: ATP-dependent DNA helicase RecG [Acidobacteriota bacterium]|nr:ATP-dependent DNA helicase RecG [Acidobacteriota bacterium]MDH3529025.1 ATP-dependent DNA helicase RecG [Acidobacteriota bacterium]
MKLKIDSSLIELSKCGIAGISQPMSRKLAAAIASYTQKPDLKDATVEDLLAYYPMRYEDRSNLMPLDQIEEGKEAAVELYTRVAGGFQVGRRRPRGSPPLFIFEITASDKERAMKPVVVWWFISGKSARRIISFWKDKFRPGSRFIAFGEWKWDSRRNTYALNLKKPDELEILPDEAKDEVELEPSELVEDAESPAELAAVHVGRRVPVYRKLGDFQTKRLREIVFDALGHLDKDSVDESLPGQISQRLKLVSRAEALKEIHFPPDESKLEEYANARSEAHRRLIFEEFFWLSFALRYKRGLIAAEPKGPTFEISRAIKDELARIVPFKLTGAQKRVVEEIFNDMASNSPMNRLIQGDVGSGKTIVAFMAAYVAVRNGYQAVLMAPTEILAEQHFRNAKRLFSKSDIEIDLLTGSLKETAKKDIHKKIRAGFAELLIGTHALIQDAVEFHKLGLAIIDEQHRFGVAQRAELRENAEHPDILVMTATPIPRSLAMTVYGDLEVSLIDELPPGRTSVKTVVVGEDKRNGVYKGIEREIKAGRQVYIVYPLIEESEKLDLKAATDMYKELQDNAFPGKSVGLLHGRMKPDEKEAVMAGFTTGKVDILVSTTVIEVGVDVPNATLMIIEHAERFGLSQLHQLRGRVGRGADQSYCVLLAGVKKTAVARERLGIMEDSSDGFEIAEKDLELRGQGDIVGTRQSGLQSFRLANIIRDLPILLTAREEADRFFDRHASDGVAAELVDKMLSDPRLRFYGVG